MYRLNSLNADIQLIVDGASENLSLCQIIRADQQICPLLYKSPHVLMSKTYSCLKTDNPEAIRRHGDGRSIGYFACLQLNTLLTWLARETLPFHCGG